MASFLFLIAACWLAAWMTQNVCFGSSPDTVSFYINRRGNDPCIKENGVPCHVYITFGHNTTKEVMVHFHASQLYENPIAYLGTAPGNHIPANYEFNVVPKVKKIEIEIDRYVYYAYFNELLPDTDYYFTVGFINQENEFVHAAEKKFRTTPATRPYNFITGGDMGISPDVETLVSVSATTNPFFAAIGGDIAYENNYPGCYERWDKFFDIWDRNAITSDNYVIPFITAIGNHEAGGFDQGSTLFYSRYFVHENIVDDVDNIPVYHSHVIADTILLSLDSAVLNHPADQVEFIEAELQKVEENAPKFAIYHAPLYPSVRQYNNYWTTLVRDAWGPVFDSHKLTVGLENHDHAYKVTPRIKNEEPDVGGTLYIGDGCWGTKPRQTVGQDDRWWIDRVEAVKFFFNIEVTDTEVNINAIDSDANVFDNIVITL